jgi:thiol-disulfide isomerase/thioredoxin
MLKKTILIIALIALSNLQAYKAGDTIDPKIIETLKLDNSKITVIDFFASWCISCKKELPLVNDLYKSIDKTKIDIVGVDTDKEIKKGKAFQQKLGLEFRVVDDTTQDIISAFDPVGMPACYIVKEGKVVDAIFGAVPEVDKKLKKKIDAL